MCILLEGHLTLMKWRLTLKTGYLQNTSHHRYQTFWMEWKVWTSWVPPAVSRNYCVQVERVWSNLPAVKLLKWDRIWAGATPMRAKWIKLDLVWINCHVVIASTAVPLPTNRNTERLSQAKLVAHPTKRFHWSRLTELSEEPEQRPTKLNIYGGNIKFSQFSC